MTKWDSSAKEFEVTIRQDKKKLTNTTTVPKPILDFLNNPEKIKFVIDGKVVKVVSSV